MLFLIDMKHKNLQTERLILRKFKLGDVHDVFNNWTTNYNVTKYVTWLPHKNIDETKQIVKMWIDSFKTNTPSWAIVDKHSNQVIGNIAVVLYRDKIPQYVEIGYCLSEKFWGKGIMPEALRAIVKYCFEDWGIDRIQAKHDVDNPNSGKVMSKAGLLYEGKLYGRAHNNTNPICDVCIYGLSKAQYFEKIGKEYLRYPTKYDKDIWLDYYQEFKKVYPESNPLDYKYEVSYDDWLTTKIDEHNAFNLQPNRVPASVFFMIKNNKIVGHLSIRHSINNDFLKLVGGHIGDGIRPSCQNQGLGTKLLQLAKIECKKLGLKKVLVTCKKSNIASRRCIEKNGGVLIDEIEFEQTPFLRFNIKI